MGRVSHRTYILPPMSYSVSQMSSDSCPVCGLLWRDYGRATAEHVRLLKEQDEAAGRDDILFRQLEPQIESAGILREQARAAIKAHLEADHSEPTYRATTAG